MERPERFFSHAAIEIRSVRWLPIFCQSGILLDLSPGGFKIEVMGDIRRKAGDRFWINMPLVSFGINDLESLDLLAEAKWVDTEKCRLGGVFVDLDAQSRETIERIVARLSAKTNSKV